MKGFSLLVGVPLICLLVCTLDHAEGSAKIKKEEKRRKASDSGMIYSGTSVHPLATENLSNRGALPEHNLENLEDSKFRVEKTDYYKNLGTETKTVMIGQQYRLLQGDSTSSSNNNTSESHIEKKSGRSIPLNQRRVKDVEAQEGGIGEELGRNCVRDVVCADPDVLKTMGQMKKQDVYVREQLSRIRRSSRQDRSTNYREEPAVPAFGGLYALLLAGPFLLLVVGYHVWYYVEVIFGDDYL